MNPNSENPTNGFSLSNGFRSSRNSLTTGSQKNSRHLFTVKSAPQDYPVNNYVYSCFNRKSCVDCVPNSNSYYNPVASDNFFVNLFHESHCLTDENRIRQWFEKNEKLGPQSLSMATDSQENMTKHRNKSRHLSTSSVRVLKISLFLFKKLLQAHYDSILCPNMHLNIAELAQKRQLPMVYVTRVDSDGTNTAYENITKQLILQLVLFLRNFRLPRIITIDEPGIQRTVFSSILKWFNIDTVAHEPFNRVTSSDSQIYSYRQRLTNHLKELVTKEVDLNIQITGDVYSENDIIECLLELIGNREVYDAVLVPASVKIEKLELRGLVESKSFDSRMDSNSSSASTRDNEFKITRAFKKLIGCLRFFYHSSKAIALNISSGNLRVDFSQPFSIKEYIEVVDEKLSRMSKNRSNRLSSLNAHLRSHVIHDISQVETVMCSDLVAFALMNSLPSGLTNQLLVNRCEMIKKELILNLQIGFNCSTTTNLTYPLLERSIKLFKDHLNVMTIQPTRDRSARPAKLKSNQKEVLITVKDNVDSILALYRSSKTIYQSFFVQSVLATSLLSLTKKDLYLNLYYLKNNLVVKESELFTKSFELIKIMRYAFNGYKRSCESIYSKINDKILKFKNVGIISDQHYERYEGGFKFKNGSRGGNDRSNASRPNYFYGFDDDNSENEDDESFTEPQINEECENSKFYDFDRFEIMNWLRKQEKGLHTSKTYEMNLQDEGTWEKVQFLNRIIKPFIEAFLSEFEHLINLFQPERLRIPENELLESYKTLTKSNHVNSKLVKIILTKMNALEFCQYEGIITRVREDLDKSLESPDAATPSQDDVQLNEVYYEITGAGYGKLISTYKSLQTFV